MTEPEAQHSPEFHTFGKGVADPETAVRIHRSFSHLFLLTVELLSCKKKKKGGNSLENHLCHIIGATCKFSCAKQAGRSYH